MVIIIWHYPFAAKILYKTPIPSIHAMIQLQIVCNKHTYCHKNILQDINSQATPTYLHL